MFGSPNLLTEPVVQDDHEDAERAHEDRLGDDVTRRRPARALGRIHRHQPDQAHDAQHSGDQGQKAEHERQSVEVLERLSKRRQSPLRHALTDCGLRVAGFPQKEPIRSARSKSGSIKTWRSSAREAGRECVQALPEPALEFVWTHGWRLRRRTVAAHPACLRRYIRELSPTTPAFCPEGEVVSHHSAHPT